MKMRLRTDGSFFDGDDQDDPRPKPQPGDTWRIYWYHLDEEGNQINDWLAGYAICCPKCLKVHHWTTASNCPRTPEGCAHEKAHTSCWTWTGSAEEGTLTASPSLFSVEALGGCGWHGWLQNGELHN